MFVIKQFKQISFQKNHHKVDKKIRTNKKSPFSYSNKHLQNEPLGKCL